MSPLGPLREHMNLRHMGWIGCSIPPPPPNGFKTLLSNSCREVWSRSRTGLKQVKTKSEQPPHVHLNIFPFKCMSSTCLQINISSVVEHLIQRNTVSNWKFWLLHPGYYFQQISSKWITKCRFSKSPIRGFSGLTATVLSKPFQISYTNIPVSVLWSAWV